MFLRKYLLNVYVNVGFEKVKVVFVFFAASIAATSIPAANLKFV